MEITIFRKRLNQKLSLIFILNIVDWLCTVVLLATERFREANPLMREVIVSLPLGFLAKCLFPAAAISAVMLLLRRLDLSGLRTTDRFISFVLVFYLAVNFDHVLNFLLLFFRNNT